MVLGGPRSVGCVRFRCREPSVYGRAGSKVKTRSEMSTIFYPSVGTLQTRREGPPDAARGPPLRIPPVASEAQGSGTLGVPLGRRRAPRRPVAGDAGSSPSCRVVDQGGL